MHETHGGALVEGKTHFIARGVCIDFVLFCFVFHDLRDPPFFFFVFKKWCAARAGPDPDTFLTMADGFFFLNESVILVLSI